MAATEDRSKERMEDTLQREARVALIGMGLHRASPAILHQLELAAWQQWQCARTLDLGPEAQPLARKLASAAGYLAASLRVRRADVWLALAGELHAMLLKSVLGVPSEGVLRHRGFLYFTAEAAALRLGMDVGDLVGRIESSGVPVPMVWHNGQWYYRADHLAFVTQREENNCLYCLSALREGQAHFCSRACALAYQQPEVSHYITIPVDATILPRLFRVLRHRRVDPSTGLRMILIYGLEREENLLNLKLQGVHGG